MSLLDQVMAHPEWGNLNSTEKGDVVNRVLAKHPQWGSLSPDEQTDVRNRAYLRVGIQNFHYDPAQAEQVEPGVTQGLQPSMIQPADLATFGAAGGAEAAGKAIAEGGTGLAGPLVRGAGAALMKVPGGLGISAASQSLAQPLTSMIPTDTPLGVLERGTAEQIAGMAPFMTGGAIPESASSAWQRFKGATPVAEEARAAAEKQDTANLAEQEKLGKAVTGEGAEPSARERFADVHIKANREMGEQVAKLRTQSAEKVLPEAKQAAIGSVPSATMEQSPERQTRDLEFRAATHGPLTKYRQDWGRQRDALLAEHMDKEPDVSPVREGAQAELAKWPPGHAPYHLAVANLLDETAHLGEAKVPDDAELLKAAGYEPQEIQAMFAPRSVQPPTVRAGEMREPSSPTAGEPNIPYGQAVIKQLRNNWVAEQHAAPKVSDLLTLQAQAGKLARSMTGANQTAAKVVSRSIDDALTDFVPTPELKALNAKYRDHRAHFPYQFEDKIEKASRPLEVAPDLFNFPERTLDLARLGGDRTKQAILQLYGQWIGPEGGGTIKPADAAFLKEVAPNTPYADPKGWVYEKKAEDHLSQVIDSSPEVKSRWQALVDKGKQEYLQDYSQKIANFAFKDAPRFGPMGQRLITAMRAAHVPEAQMKLAGDFYSKLTPEQAGLELSKEQLDPSESAIQAIQERGYKPTPLTGTMKRRMFWTIPGGIGGYAAYGHPGGYVLGSLAMDVPVAAREALVRSFQNSLRDPVEARRFYQAITNPGTRGNFEFLAGEAAKAGITSAAERAGYDMSIPQPHSEEGPGLKSLGQSRAEAVAPTPSASTRAMKVGKDLSKGRQPDVHRDLARGRLSEPEVEKLLQYANSTDPSSIVQGMPIEEVLNAAEVAGPDERKMLMPMIMQRLKVELPKMQNKTQQANLAQRFQRLQALPAQAEA